VDAASPRGEAGTTLTVLGCGTLVPDHRRHGAAHLVEATGVRILLDCGPGTLDGLVRHGVAWQELTHVAVTHYHVDHVGDLSALLMALKRGTSPRRTRPLTLIGPHGFGDFLERLAAATGGHVTDPGFPVTVVELGPGEPFDDADLPVRISAHPTPHTAESVAYRVEVAGTVVAYTGDTGPSASLSAFVAECDVLVAECTQPDPPELDTHLSPTGLADLVDGVGAGLVVVTHVGPPGTPESVAAWLRERCDGAIVAGSDGLTVRVPAP
jgi:ribonuclease BN (tRNA processing enzyme)